MSRKFIRTTLVIAWVCLSILIPSLLYYSWVEFDCLMRDWYSRDHYHRIFTKEQCLEKRRREGHWY